MSYSQQMLAKAKRAVQIVSVIGFGLVSWSAQALTINVVDPSGNPVPVGFRYTLEEDKTWDVVPGITGTRFSTAPVDQTLALNFHRSYMPVIETGRATGNTVDIAATLTPGARYFISVMPDAGANGGVFQMGGAPIRSLIDGTLPASVNVVVNPLPIKSSQISVLIYDDKNPINSQGDAVGNQEFGLCGFQLHLYDAGGTYGASGGRISADTFGNPLGTEYHPTNTNSDGTPFITKLGDNVILTDRNGIAKIKNLAPAKYTIFSLAPNTKPSQASCPGYYPTGIGGRVPPVTPWYDAGGEWMQTTTIEGTWGDDAWVKANEPGYFKEFGPPGHHVEQGFVRTFVDATKLNGAGTLKGKGVNIHMSRPPNYAFFNGHVIYECSIGLNEVSSTNIGNGVGVAAKRCNDDGTFEFKGLKPNQRYQINMWDKPLDMVHALYDFVTDASGNVDLGNVPYFGWFGNVQGQVCFDKNDLGFCGGANALDPIPGQPGKFRAEGVPGVPVNIRFRDGSIYQSVVTDDAGNYEFPEVFPFFNWMVAEVDFARLKATGMTAITDNGGEVPADNDWIVPSRNRLTPQVPNSTDPTPNSPLARTETAPLTLLQGIQTFLGTTNVIDWGKRPYVGNENGGITGVVHYASTRAENDPRYATAENNEPGIPGVSIRLYRASAANPRVPDGPAIDEVVTDSWDNALPSACPGAQYTIDGVAIDCYDGLRNFNQIRNAVFDGGYAFINVCPGLGDPLSTTGCAGGVNKVPMVPGRYIVEVVPPVGYEIQKEEDKNVDFGDGYVVTTLANLPECVGQRPFPVKAELDLFPGVPVPSLYRDNPPTDAATYASYVGVQRAYCDRKAVTLEPKMNAAADFHLFTAAPVAGHITGIILDDLANEFDPHAPAFGEKYAPPFMPISLRDWSGREFSRVYSDRFGTYNAMVPSTFSFNIPIPSGVSPNMVTACLNSPFKPVKDANGNDVLDANGRVKQELDQHYNKSYSQFCYTFQYLPGKTTYLDTPVVPLAAFAGPQQFPLDCEQQDATPGIKSVNNAADTGPYAAAAGAPITITSMGPTQVLNPLYNIDDQYNTTAAGASTQPKLISRNFGFGAATGTVTVNGVVVPTSSWSNDTITFNAPAVGGTVLVKSATGVASARGVTLHVGGPAPVMVAANDPWTTITFEGETINRGPLQTAIDNAAPGALITVRPGLYQEAVIIDKRVRVQGFGAPVTLLNAIKQPVEKLRDWRALSCAKVRSAGGAQFLIGSQTVPANMQDCLNLNPADNSPALFGDEEGPGFFVLGKAPNQAGFASINKLQIDGFTVSGADQGGGILANARAHGFEVSNNLITGNQGIMAGGIRIGHPTMTNPNPVSSQSPDVNIHHNEIVQNGDTAGDVGGGGGGIGMYFGADRYKVTNNFICGNFSTGNGGGMSHQGVSTNGVINNNQFLWNASFYQGSSVQGGGLFISGVQSVAAAAAVEGGAPVVGLSTGSGNVVVSNNTFQGNLAGAGDGGGIALVGVNGNELTLANKTGYRVDIVNNVIANNVAGVAGGGIALKDSPNTFILNNTITRNDNSSTGARAFVLNTSRPPINGLSSSTAQPGAGVVSYAHSNVLAARLAAVASPATMTAFSGKSLFNNIVQDNRKFHWQLDYSTTNPAGCQVNTTTNACYRLVQDAGTDIDLAVIPAITGSLPSNAASGNLLTGAANFVATYFNGGRDAIIQSPESTTGYLLSVAAAFDEGGNFIDVRYGPLTPRNPTSGLLYGDYRVQTGSAAAGIANNRTNQPALLNSDKAGNPRPPTGAWTAGAYNVQ
jgi:large repetitive protein